MAEEFHTIDPAEISNPTLTKINGFGKAISKMEYELNSLSGLHAFNEQVPALFKIQSDFIDSKKKCNNAVQLLESKIEKFEQISTVYTDANNETKKVINEEALARKKDIKKVEEHIAKIEKQTKLEETKVSKALSESDNSHQEDMVRVATELNAQIEGEREYTLQALYKEELKSKTTEDQSISSPKLLEDAKLLSYCSSPYEYIYPIEDIKVECMKTYVMNMKIGDSNGLKIMTEFINSNKAIEDAFKIAISDSFYKLASAYQVYASELKVCFL